MTAGGIEAHADHVGLVERGLKPSARFVVPPHAPAPDSRVFEGRQNVGRHQ